MGDPRHSHPDPVTRFRFMEVRSALYSHWGLSRHRGGEQGDSKHDGRWDTSYSKTGYVVGGQLPGLGHGYRRFATLANIVTACDLEHPNPTRPRSARAPCPRQKSA